MDLKDEFPTISSIYVGEKMVEVHLDNQVQIGIEVILDNGERIHIYLDTERDTVELARGVPVVIEEATILSDGGLPVDSVSYSREATREEIEAGDFSDLCPTSEVKVFLPRGRISNPTS